MTTIEQEVQAIRASVAAFTSYPALLVVTKAPEEPGTERLEVHLLNVPPQDAFRVMDELVQHLMPAFGGSCWIVFAHGAAASSAIRARFFGRGEILHPSTWWRELSSAVIADAPEWISARLPAAPLLSGPVARKKALCVVRTIWDRGAEVSLKAAPFTASPKGGIARVASFSPPEPDGVLTHPALEPKCIAPAVSDLVDAA